jgi:hypothetical protein
MQNSHLSSTSQSRTTMYKNDHRNRLLSLLIAGEPSTDCSTMEDDEEETTTTTTTRMETTMDDRDLIIEEDDESIMRSNFSLSIRLTDDSGGGGGSCGDGGGEGACETKRKRLSVNDNNHHTAQLNERRNEAFHLLRNELLHHSTASDRCQKTASQDYESKCNSMSSSSSTMHSSTSSTPVWSSSSSSSSSASSRPGSPRSRQYSDNMLAIRFNLNLTTQSAPPPTTTTMAASLWANNTSSELYEYMLDENVRLRPLNNLLKYSLNNTLNVTRKDTLIFLIELNLKANVHAPFDLFAYERLKKLNRLVTSSPTPPPTNSKLNYNYAQVRRLSKLEQSLLAATGLLDAGCVNPLERKLLKHNTMLANCVSTFLMPFYFDIFKVSELNEFSHEQCQMMLALKRAYRAEPVCLTYDSLIGYFRENILWNCFTLFKYKFRAQTNTQRMGFFNFYLTFVHIQTHLERVVAHCQRQQHQSPQHNQLAKEHITKAMQLASCLPYLLDTLILTGMFRQPDAVRFRKFYTNKYLLFNRTAQSQPNDSEIAYYERAYKSVEQKTSGTCFPLKLKHLCRIRVKESLVAYNWASVDQLNIPKSVKSFLLYDNEIKDFFLKDQFSKAN